MDLNTITDVVRPAARAEMPKWSAGDAWLAGGTWLFSEPQAHLTRLIDLTALGWPSLRATPDALEISATCTVAELDAWVVPPEWTAAPLIGQCCRAFLASFKIWKTATVGGNLCMALPAGPMIALTAALDGVCTIWRADGSETRISVLDFIVAPQRTLLAQGDLLRQITIPVAALKRRSAFRQMSLTPVGRSGVLVIGTRDDGALTVTVTASTVRPLQLTFPGVPTMAELRGALVDILTDDIIHNDVHGKPLWRKHMTLRLAEDIRAELQQSA